MTLPEDRLNALADQVERYTVSGPYDIARAREQDLNERIAAAAGLKLTIKVGDPILGNDRMVPVRLPAYTASLDAAMTLVPKGWVIGSLDWWPSRENSGVTLMETGECGSAEWPAHGYDASIHKSARASSATPALALTAAALRALALKSGEGKA